MIPTQARILRALSGAARAQRDVDVLARELDGHAGLVALEIGGELAFQVRRISYLARLLNVGFDEIENASK